MVYVKVFFEILFKTKKQTLTRGVLNVIWEKKDVWAIWKLIENAMKLLSVVDWEKTILADFQRPKFF